MAMVGSSRMAGGCTGLPEFTSAAGDMQYCTVVSQFDVECSQQFHTLDTVTVADAAIMAYIQTLPRQGVSVSVSYTHLTLPTIYSV